MKNFLIVFLLFCSSTHYSQEYFPTNSGVKTTENNATAFTNADIYVSPTKKITNGTLLIKNGKIIEVGKNVKIPNGTLTINLEGKTIYPSFIEIYSDFGVITPKSQGSSYNNIQYESGRKGYYWNDHIRPETDANEKFTYDQKKADEFLKAGFGVVQTHNQDGIVRGTGLLVALNNTASNSERIIDKKSAQFLSFKKSNESKQAYPTSIMGAIALIKQVYYDADWYANGNIENKDEALESFNKNKNLVQIFDAGSNNLNTLRAAKIGKDVNVNYTIVGSGIEYEKIEELKNYTPNLIVPINYRKAYDVSDPFLTDELELTDMRRWNQEPANLSILSKNNISFSITTHKLKSLSQFLKNVQKAIDYGLDKTLALASLTTIPAKMLGKSDEIGSLQVGSYANFIITSGDIFAPKTTIYENWVQGQKNSINLINTANIDGEYNLVSTSKNLTLSIDKKNATVKNGEKKLLSKFNFEDGWLQLTITSEDDATKLSRYIGYLNEKTKNFEGKLINEFGEESPFTATKIATKIKKDTKEQKTKKETKTILPITYPNTAFGYTNKPNQKTILFKNATVWTSENEGTLYNTDVLIKNGKIEKIGTNLKDRNAQIIDATNKHLTAGIIDEHSHIAASSINEAGHNSSAEVSIEDVINPDDFNIYRNLAGGVTTSQILHGSANPIGGKSAIIKLKWGAAADEMIYENSPKFIKFALGENVKQSRFQNGTRFPQTRMGVEQVFIDYFQRAKEYDALKKSGKPYRKDIELETLAEILNKERFISCHSYVQSEINMLMKVAEKFNFNINTFTHILEGYKVADKMKKHGVGGSTFSDWWAYKYEVNDAIPYNAAIMHNQGITVAINSDDSEMSRRLNQEAAKSIKYGGVSELEAWKFITINPAKLLHIDDRVGSIKEGKDADVVLWSSHPMSIYSKAEKTIINGVIYFDIEEDKLKREAIKNERNKLINMMLNEKQNGQKVQTPKPKMKREFHCDTEETHVH